MGDLLDRGGVWLRESVMERGRVSGGVSDAVEANANRFVRRLLL